MSKTKRKPELNVDLIGGESLSEIEKKQLSTFFREEKEKQQKRRTKRAVSKKKTEVNPMKYRAKLAKYRQ